MNTPEADLRRHRLLQVVEVTPGSHIAGSHVVEALRGFHFSVTDAAFRDDLAWLGGQGLIETGPCGTGVWISLTERGTQAIDSLEPPEGQACLRVPLRIDLGRGAHLTLDGAESISDAKLRTLAEAARELVRAVLDVPAAPDRGAQPDAHLGATESS